ncbi:MAG TPA: methyltransferase domain-containing protein [Polyangiaceae bacterium]|nr:methyltransferase domain-containing protein [Polyangiaceae bacterium]
MPLEGVQFEAFGAADADHFAWVTGHEFVADRERALTESAFLPLGERILDVGCGEGATLFHLGRPEGAVGIDASEDKIAFCREHVPGPEFMVADAEELPFEDDRFDHVIVRDVFHHLPEPSQLVNEIARVLEPTGRLDVLEPCAFNPLVALHAIVTPAERGELESTPSRLSAMLSARFTHVAVTRHQALPVHRVVFHPRLGRPGWHGARPAVAALERVAQALMPQLMWSYIHLRARGHR